MVSYLKRDIFPPKNVMQVVLRDTTVALHPKSLHTFLRRVHCLGIIVIFLLTILTMFRPLVPFSQASPSMCLAFTSDVTAQMTPTVSISPKILLMVETTADIADSMIAGSFSSQTGEASI